MSTCLVGARVAETAREHSLESRRCALDCRLIVTWQRGRVELTTTPDLQIEGANCARFHSQQHLIWPQLFTTGHTPLQEISGL